MTMTTMGTTSENNPRYLIDTNCLVTPYNDYYRLRYAMSSSFWKRLKELVDQEEVGILMQVEKEILAGSKDNDALNDWMQSVKQTIINPLLDLSVLAVYQSIMRYLADERNEFSQKAQRSWMSSKIADPWLIATAKCFNATIITFEKSVGRVKGQPAAKVKIPDIATVYGVRCISLFDFMDEVSGF
ncbi:DUF4411 family protein [Bifidobacterium thermophilum]|uniref:DUF4411 family protein n=1 Tax=Bifidobacterium thermophilum TaxID=33905 RepID=UPI0030A7EF89